MSGVGSDPLEQRLSQALRAGLSDSPVDTPGLLDGARRRVRRVKQRRVAGIAAFVALVLAVPVGYEVAHPEASKYGTPAALLPGAKPSPIPTLPDSLAFAATDLPPGLTRELSLVSDRVPVVSGQQCSDGAGLRPKTGHQWSWSNGGSDATKVSVNLTITRWADSSAAFTQLVTDTGVCHWVSNAPTQHAFSARGAASSWSATSDFSSLHYGRAVVRVGNLLAGVEVQSPTSTTGALTTAQQLATTLTPRLKKAA